jgi:broad specificity phosphatase PhoE
MYERFEVNVQTSNRNRHPLIFIRHGETDWNRQGLIQGSIETDLNDQGREQARSLAALLHLQGARLRDFDLIVSPQKRAQQTMHVIASALDRSDVKTDVRVRELAFGIWEGKPFWELKASPVYPADNEGRFFWRPEGGESYQDGVARVAEWHAELTRPTLVVAHGAVGRCLMGFVAGLDPVGIVQLSTPQGCYCDLSEGKVAWFDATGKRA